MTIKGIKETWGNMVEIQGCRGKKQFAVYGFGGFGKCVVVVVNECGFFGRTVVAVVQVSSGEDLLKGEHSRPCDNMDDALDVAGEMLSQMIADGEIEEPAS